jgi:hypothetical protein
MVVGIQRHTPAALPAGKRPIFTGGWVGPTTGLDEWAISRPPRDSITEPFIL